MGLIRDFTRETKERLINNIEDNDGFIDQVDDFFGDSWLHIKHAFNSLQLNDDMSNVEQYHRDIIDKNNTTVAQIKTIYQNVYAVENKFTGVYRQNKDSLSAYKDIMNQLTEAIDDRDFAANFDMDEWRMKMSDAHTRLTWRRWEEILDLPADQITAEQYRKIAYILMITEDDHVVEAILNKCYMPHISYTNSEKEVAITTWAQSPKLEKIYDEMQILTYSLMAELENASEEKQVLIWKSNTMEKAVQRTQLFQSFTLNTDIIATNGLYSASPEIKLTWDNDSYILKYRTLDDSISGSGIAAKDTAEEAEDDRMRSLNPDWKWYPASIDQDHHHIVSASETVVTVSKWKYGFTADEFNKLETNNYISSYFGLSKNEIYAAGAKTIDKVQNKVVSAMIGALPGSSYINAAKDIYEVGAAAYKKSQDKEIFEIITGISNIGAVADLFNMSYISTNINDDSKKHTYSLYPTPYDPDNPDYQSTFTCIQKLNDNLLNNPKYSQLADDVGFTKPLTMDDLMDDPQKAVDLIDNLCQFAPSGVDVRKLVVQSYSK